MQSIFEFLAHCGITAVALWLASLIFHGVKFSDKASLSISAVLLGTANAIIKPIVIMLTIPLTVFSFGFFLLVINALMMLLVSTLVKGFKVDGFWTALFASTFISIVSFIAGLIIFHSSNSPAIIHSNNLLVT